MAHLLSPVPVKKRCTFTMLCGSLLFHGTLVGTAALWTHPAVPEPVDEGLTFIDVGPEPEPRVDYQPLGLPTFVPPEIAPPAQQNPDPHTDTPPDLTQDIVDLVPARLSATQQTTPARKPSKPAVPGASIGVRSNGNAASITGGPSGLGIGQPASSTAASGWKISKPIYPANLRSQHVQGAAKIRITTDTIGRVSEIVILRSTGNRLLDENIIQHAHLQWSGPPNASTVREVEYKLQ